MKFPLFKNWEWQQAEIKAGPQIKRGNFKSDASYYIAFFGLAIVLNISSAGKIPSAKPFMRIEVQVSVWIKQYGLKDQQLPRKDEEVLYLNFD